VQKVLRHRAKFSEVFARGAQVSRRGRGSLQVKRLVLRLAGLVAGRRFRKFPQVLAACSIGTIRGKRCAHVLF
jgi:hypothetical protein